MKKPTPKFFTKLRNLGLTLTGISAAILAVPMPLPEILVEASGYLAVGAAVMSGVSQSAVKNEKK